MKSGIFKAKNGHKVRGRNFLTFMVITDATKNAKVFRVPKWIRFPILILAVIAVFQGLTFYRHVAELELAVAENRLEAQVASYSSEDKDREIARLIEEKEYIETVQAEQIYELAEKANLADNKVEIIDGQYAEVGESMTTVATSLGAEDELIPDSIEVAIQPSEILEDIKASDIQTIDQFDDSDYGDTDEYQIMPNQGGVANEVIIDIENINIADEINNINALYDSVLSEVEVVEEKYEETAAVLEEMIPYVESYPSVLPIEDTYITSYFGYRKNPFGFRSSEFHSGVDLKAYYEPVRATGAGVVIESKYLSGYGYTVIIDHGYGLMTKYAHNSKLYVNVGDTVVRGDIISKSGNTGRSTGPHLHYEILLDGEAVNPLDYIYQEGEIE